MQRVGHRNDGLPQVLAGHDRPPVPQAFSVPNAAFQALSAGVTAGTRGDASIHRFLGAAKKRGAPSRLCRTWPCACRNSAHLGGNAEVRCPARAILRQWRAPIAKHDGTGAATSVRAQALFCPCLPRARQNWVCLQTIQEMILLSSRCIGGCANDIGLRHHGRTPDQWHSRKETSDERRSASEVSPDLPIPGQGACGARRASLWRELID